MEAGREAACKVRGKQSARSGIVKMLGQMTVVVPRVVDERSRITVAKGHIDEIHVERS